MTLPLRLYRGVCALAAPLVARHLRRRAGRGKEDPARLEERFGAPSRPRPPGRLVWIHAASVGESLSALPLIAALRAEPSAPAVLMTTGTVASAGLIARRAPELTHQFVPADVPAWGARFLDHWRPDAALWMESELWPNLARATAARGVPMALVNARISAGSARNWGFAPRSAATVLGGFQALLPQSERVRDRLRALGAPPERLVVTGDLKASRAPEPADPQALSAMRAQIGGRPLWLAASTHPGEEEAVLDAHAALAERAPDLLTLLVPRHPERGARIAALCAARGLACARRSLAEPASAPVYIADTLGETALWFTLAPIAFIGAGWGDLGGHNPLEAAQRGAAVLSGPRVANFEESYARLIAAGGARLVEDADALAAALRELTDSQGRPNAAARAMAQAGRAAGAPDPEPLRRTLAALRPVLERARS